MTKFKPGELVYYHYTPNPASPIMYAMVLKECKYAGNYDILKLTMVSDFINNKVGSIFSIGAVFLNRASKKNKCIK